MAFARECERVLDFHGLILSLPAHFAGEVKFPFCHRLDGQALPALHHLHRFEIGIVLEVFQADIRLECL